MKIQEWTPEKVKHPTDGFRHVVLTQVGDFSAHCLKCAKSICDAHNAALAKAHQDGWYEGRNYEIKLLKETK